jgi:hypothetical protein
MLAIVTFVLLGVLSEATRSETLVMSKTELALSVDIFGYKRTRRFNGGEIRNVRVDETYSRRHVRIRVAFDHDGQTIRTEKVLARDEADAIVAAWAEVVADQSYR